MYGGVAREERRLSPYSDCAPEDGGAYLLSLQVVRMIWWFLILGISTVVVISVATTLYMRVRRQMKLAATLGSDSESANQSASPPKN